MKLEKLKKIFLIFVVIFVCTQYLLWQILNSSYFSGWVSDLINHEFAKNDYVKFSFKGVGISFYPPGLEIQNVEIQSKKKIEFIDLFSANGERLIVQLHLFSHTGSKYRISNIELQNAKVDISFDDQWRPSSSKDDNYWWPKDIRPALASIMETTGVDILRFAISDTEIKSNWSNLIAKEVSIERSQKNYYGKIIIQNTSINPPAVKNLNLPYFELFESEFKLTPNSIFVEKLISRSPELQLNASGEIAKYYDANLAVYNAELKIKSNETLDEILGIEKYVNFGVSELSSKVTGKLKNPKIDSKVEVSDIESTYFNAAFLSINTSYEFGELSVKNIYIKDRQGGVLESEELELAYNLEKRKLLKSFGNFDLKRFSLKDALHYVRPVAKVVNGTVTGSVQVNVAPENYAISISGSTAQISDLALTLNESAPLLALPTSKIDNFSFKIQNGLVFNTRFIYGASVVNLDGEISGGNLKIVTDEFPISMSEWRPLSNLNLNGKGKMKIRVEGPLENVKMNFEHSLQEASFLDYSLGHNSANWFIDFASKNIVFNQVETVLVSGKVTGSGKLNLESKEINFDLSSQGISLSDTFHLLNPIIGQFEYLSPYLSVNLKSSINISGKFDQVDKLLVNGFVGANKLVLLTEDFHDFNTKIKLENNKLEFNSLAVQKGKGRIDGRMLLDLKQREIAADWNTFGLSLQDWNLHKKLSPALQSDVMIKGKVSGPINNYTISGEVLLENTMINGDAFEDSSITYFKNGNIYNFDANYMNNAINMQMSLDYEQSKEELAKKSSLSLKVNSGNWIPFINAFFSFDNNDELLNGNLKMDLSSKFNVNNLARLDLTFDINELSLTHPQIDLKQTKYKSILIQNGKIENWDLRFFAHKGDQFISKGRGDFGDTVIIENMFNLNMQKINLFSSYYGEFLGNLKSFSSFLWQNGKWDYEIKFNSDDFALEGEGGNLLLGKTNFDISMKDSRLIVSEFKSQMGAGVMSWIGSIDLSRRMDLPTDFNGQFYNVTIPYGKKSQVVLKGNLSVTGQDLAYLTKGDLVIVGGSMNDEIEDFKFEKKSKEKNHRFLPRTRTNDQGVVLNYDVNIFSERPYLLKNTQLDLKIVPNLKLRGESKSPRLSGAIVNAPDLQNFVWIKGNTFQVGKLDLNFDEKSEIDQFVFNCETQSRINQYIVYAKVYGTLKDYKLDLRSEPNLPEQSILSLIAFGYAEDITQNLSESERSALSGVGIGSFLFDRLKLNQSLNSTLGIQLNVGTQYVQDSASVLDGRNTANSSGSSSNVGRVRTATKLELKKKFSEKMNMSVSSTVGGAVGQRQSMNFNYSINKNVYLDGVYDINTDQSGTVDRVGTSAGGDVKFKWTFK
jgi:translocation and assembly module TamB